jgi:hypothetical protein
MQWLGYVTAIITCPTIAQQFLPFPDEFVAHGPSAFKRNEQLDLQAHLTFLYTPANPAHILRSL